MSYFKYILKGFKANISRLLAIVAIITLGIGFLVGLTTSSEDVRTSVDTMYGETEVMDLNLKSTIGFSKETVSRLDERNDMMAEGVYQLEAKESFVNTVKVKSRLISSDLKNSRINKLELIDGRMPQAESECVVLKDMGIYHKTKIGDKIRVVDDKTDVDKGYTVVGIVKSPLFFAKDKEYNLTGTNRLDLIFFVDSNYYDFEAITDIYIRADVNANRFGSGYFNRVAELEEDIKALNDDILASSRESVKNTIREEIIDTKLPKIKEEVDKEILKEIRIEILKPENYNELIIETDKEIRKKIKEEILKEENYNELKATVDSEIRNKIRDEILKEANYNELKATVDSEIKKEIRNEILKEANYNELKATVDSEIKKGIRNEILKEANYNELKATVDSEIKKGIRNEILKEESYNALKAQVDKSIKDNVKTQIEKNPEAKAQIEVGVKAAIIPELRKQFTTDPQFAGFLNMAINNGIKAHKDVIKEELIEAGNPAPTQEEIDAEYAIRSEAEKQQYKDAAIDSFVESVYTQADPNNPDTMDMLKPLAEQKKLAYAKALDAAADKYIADNITEADKEAAYQSAVDSAVETGFAGISETAKNNAYSEAVDTAVETGFNGMAQADKDSAYATAVATAVETGFSEMAQADKDSAYATAVDKAVETGFTDMSIADKDKAYAEALDTAVETGFTDMSIADKNKAYSEALDTAVETGFTEMDPAEKEDAYNTAIAEAVDIAYTDEILNGNEEKLYVLNLKSNQSYVSVRENAKKIDNIAVIFPVFFYFIAALVALTTITRLVNEERSTIGLFKSLGFSKGKILSKYLIFAVVCSVIGSLIGSVCGVYGLPYVVYQAYNTILDLPPIVYTVEGLITGISIGMMILTVMGVATYVTLTSLKEKPAELLMPKAPKPGKRLLLERWKGLWKRISFKYKNTLRNIFRYKKNLAMMMAGVGGCVALLLTAFGIRDAFDKLASVQYDKIVEYDIRVSVDTGTSLPEDILAKASSYERLYGEVTYIEGDDDYAINKAITNSPLEGYFDFSHKGKKVEFNNGDVLIDEQLAKDFKLKVGSTFKLEDDDNTYTVAGIFENHMDNFIFIYDDSLTDSDANTYLINLKDGVDENELLDKLALENVTGVESTKQRKDSFNTMLGSVVLILVVVIICSGALAIIVIYNLTNININERFKEIATLKVLGYQNREVYGYIYREILILTIFGILLGFLIGPFLYQFVMLNLHEPGLFLPMSVHPLNYLYSFLFTLLFAFIVDLILIHKIKSIKMVESLKCVD